MKVFVYRNLNRKGVLYSLKAVDGPYKGLVVGYAHEILLANVVYKVSEAGRRRVLKNKRKNVHAGVVGDVVKVDGYKPRAVQYSYLLYTNTSSYEECSSNKHRQIKYSPYKHPHFYYTDTETKVIPIAESFVRLQEDGVWEIIK